MISDSSAGNTQLMDYLYVFYYYYYYLMIETHTCLVIVEGAGLEAAILHNVLVNNVVLGLKVYMNIRVLKSNLRFHKRKVMFVMQQRFNNRLRNVKHDSGSPVKQRKLLNDCFFAVFCLFI